MTSPSILDIQLKVPSNHLVVDLLGERDSHLKLIEAAFPDVRIVARGNQIDIHAGEADAEMVRTIFDELLILVQEGEQLDDDRVLRVIDLVRRDVPSPSGVFTDAIKVGRGKAVRSKTLGQKRYVDAVRDNTLVFGVGPAGTGKTYLAMACAVEALLSGSVRRIILSRPAVEAGERLGFLPGDLTAKVDPYLRPLYDALYEMLGPDETGRLMDRGTIEIAPLAYMRGRTLNDAFIVLDEAQNTSPEQMKMFLTRLGFNSKMVITGDITQTDLLDGRLSGLRVVGGVLRDIDGIAFVELTRQDVVRHRIVAAIVEAYERFEGATPSTRPRGPPHRHPVGETVTATDTRRNLRIVLSLVSTVVAVALALVVGRPAAAPAVRLEEGDIAAQDFVATRYTELVDTAATDEAQARAAEAVEPIYEIDQDATSRVEQQLGTLFAAVRDAPAPVGLTLSHEVAAVEETSVNNEFLVDYTVTVTNPASNRRTYELEQTPRLSPAATIVSASLSADLSTGESPNRDLEPAALPWALTPAAGRQQIQPSSTDTYTVQLRVAINAGQVTDANADCAIGDGDRATGLRSEARVTVDPNSADAVACASLPVVVAPTPPSGGGQGGSSTTSSSPPPPRPPPPARPPPRSRSNSRSRGWWASSAACTRTRSRCW